MIHVDSFFGDHVTSTLYFVQPKLALRRIGIQVFPLKVCNTCLRCTPCSSRFFERKGVSSIIPTTDQFRNLLEIQFIYSMKTICALVSPRGLTNHSTCSYEF